MDTIFWIPIGVISLSVLLGLYLGARSTTATAKTGFFVALYLSVMVTFPLIAVGLATV
ncbi:MAG: hypothetical protein R2700_05890 [Solirubrobacterales bacterium]|nr:hypothetical protein [Solirubrobacterales bacterium]